MNPVYIVGQNAEHPPSYEILDIQHPEDDQIWTLRHEDLWTPVVESNAAKVNELLENSRLDNLHSTYFSAATFRKSTTHLILDSDHVSDLKAFYDAIGSALKTSHSLSHRILPKFGGLQPNVSIRLMIILGSKNRATENAKHFVDVISQAILSLIKGPNSKTVIDGEKCPSARMAMDTCIDPYGLTILDTILSWKIPKLGANVDVTSAIKKLNIDPLL